MADLEEAAKRPYCFGLVAHRTKQGNYTMKKDTCEACPFAVKCGQASVALNEAARAETGAALVDRILTTYDVSDEVVSAYTGWTYEAIKAAKSKLVSAGTNIADVRFERTIWRETLEQRKRKARW